MKPVSPKNLPNRRLRAADLPAGPGGGTYVVWLGLTRPRRVAVGRLGTFRLEPGAYAYVGSAQGPGGLSARVGRHLAGSGKPRWHIDHLRRVAAPSAVWLCASPRRWEHDWAAALASLPGAHIPVPRFGAGDCRCPAHLFTWPQRPAPESFLASLGRITGVRPEISLLHLL